MASNLSLQTFTSTGRWSKNDLRPWIRFSHVVRQVTYNDSTNDFTVVVKDLSEDKVLPAERFDYVIVASGHFSVPKMPSFPGICLLYTSDAATKRIV